MRTVIIVATPFEIPECLRKIKPGDEHLIRGDSIRIIITGVGLKNTREAMKKICANPPHRIVVLGVCGTPDLDIAIGTLMFANQVSFSGTLISVPSDVKAAACARSLGLRNHTGLFESFDHPVFERGSVRTGATAIDMETFAIVEAATKANIDLIVCKAVSDRVPERRPLLAAPRLLLRVAMNMSRCRDRLDLFVRTFILHG